MSFVALNNPHTGEYGVLRQPASGPQALTIADLYARPGAAVAYEHTHPAMTETFIVVRAPGTRITVSHPEPPPNHHPR